MNTWLDNNVKNLRYAPFIKSDVLANLPASAPLGALFISTDTFAWYRYNGAGWDLIGGAGVGDITGGGTVGELAKFTGARVIGDAVAGVDYVKPSALAGYVPYTGATANVNLGGNNIQAANFIVGNQLQFSGSSGGLNLMYYSSNRFYLLSYFDTITIQGGVNDLNKRQIDFNTGDTLSAYIDINGVFWKGASSTPIADSDNSLKFATTAFVKNQGYITSASLNGYVPYTGATANVNLGAFNASANTFISDNYQAANVGGVSIKNALGQTVALMGAGNSQGTTFNGQANGTTFNASEQLIFGGSTTQDQFVRTFNSASTGRKGLNLSNGINVDMKVYTGGNQTLGNFQESDTTMVIGTGYQGGGGSLENILFHSTGIGNLFALSVPQNRAYMYLPFSVSGELTVGGDLKFAGSSGGLNLIYHNGTRFNILSYFDTITIQGGVNNANKRQIDFNTGSDLSAYIDITGIFWKGSSSTPIADSDNSLKFATTAFVKNQGYITSASLNGYVPYTGATANVNLGAFDILANDGSFSGQVGIGLSTAQQAGAKLEIDGGDIFMRNGYSVGFSSGTSGSTGGGATMIGRALGNNTNNGYAEFLSFYAGESLPYTAPIVLQNNGGNVLIGTTTNRSGYKLQTSGKILNNGISIAYQTHETQCLSYDAASSVTINLNTQFPQILLNSGNTWAVFGRCNLFSSTGQVEVREFYIGRNTAGTWAAAAYSTNSTTGATLQSVVGSGNEITINMNAGTYLQVELTVMVR